MKSTSEYKTMSVEQILHSLKTTMNGLSTESATDRALNFGYNEIAETKRKPLLEFLKRYWGPMPWLLEIAVILTIILRHYTESGIIFVLLTLNAVIGYSESRNSQKAVDLLKRKLQIQAKILRDGNWIQRDAREIVPGDVIAIKNGDFVPADVIVIEGEASVDESALTGESLPKEIHASDAIYSGSVIKRGEIKCIAVNTGAATYFGRTVELVRIAKPKSKQEELMIGIVKYMMYLGITASIIVSAYAVYLHKDVLLILSFIVIFLIGAIPMALPAVLTIVQAVGAMNLSRKGVLVTKLDSIEDAASIDVFCFDKTGTITQNKLTVVDSTAFGGHSIDELMKFAVLASKEEGMDAIDLAIIEYGIKNDVNSKEYEQVSYTPFNADIKRTETVVKLNGVSYRIIKGAAQTIMSICGSNESQSVIDAVNKTIDGFAIKGARAIAVAVSAPDDFDCLTIAGLLAISDPPRADSRSMIAKIQKLGIKCLMLTGDSMAIAKEIAGQVGIGARIMRAGDLKNLSREQQLRLIQENDGFAEVYPEDKYDIVRLLQDGGHTVGMTGDGVNDSPALKQAELGTAVSSATDVAKASASIILTRPGLSEIIDAIRISRQTYERMLTWVINKITKVFEVVVLFTVGFFWFHDIVISLLGMSLLVFANDFVTMSIATDNVKSAEAPNNWKIRNITAAALILGLFFALEDLALIFIGVEYFQLGIEKLRTLVLLSLVFNSQFRILIVRERKHFWSSFPSRNLLIVNVLTITGFSLLGIFGLFIPKLPIGQVMIILGTSAIFMAGVDFIKYHLFKEFKIY